MYNLNYGVEFDGEVFYDTDGVNTDGGINIGDGGVKDGVNDTRDGVSDVKDGVNHTRDGVKDGVNIIENDGINPVQAKILELLRDNPNITAKTISEEIGINHRNTEKNISKLKILGLIERVGSDKNGHWVVKK
jgi:hypothetical protein